LCFLCRAAATSALYTLSLHDALPILAICSPRFTRWPTCTIMFSTCAYRPYSTLLLLASGSCLMMITLPQVGRRLANTTTPLAARSEEHTSELQSRENLVCRLLLEKKK